MTKREPPKDLVLSEAELRDIIDVATRGAPHADGVTVAQLRQIAAELDISEGALKYALNDVLARRERTSPSTPKASVRSAALRFVDRLRAIPLGLIGFSLGGLAAYVAHSTLDYVVNGISMSRGSSAFIDWPVTAVLLILTYANSRSRGRDGQRTLYYIETIATWGAMAVGWALIKGRFTDDLLSLVAVCTALFCAWGWLIIEPRRPSRESAGVLEEPNTSTAPAAGAFDDKWFALTTRAIRRLGFA